MIDMLSEALALAGRGLPVFPVFDVFEFNGALRCRCSRSDCGSPAKHPASHLAPHGLRDATRDPKRIETWWHSRAWNIGLAVPRGMAVLDVDAGKGGEEALTALEVEHGSLPATWRSFTGGGGEHILFSVPIDATLANTAEKIGPGLDVRAAGGYIVAPPSLHLSGRRYAWNVDLHPDDMPLAPMPG